MSTENQVQIHTIREVNEYINKEGKKRIVRFGGGAGTQRAATPSTPTTAMPHQAGIPFGSLLQQGQQQQQQQQPSANVFASFQQTTNCDFSCFDGLTIHKICAGAVHYLVLNDKNELYSIGKNNMGQLGTMEIPLQGESRIPVKVQWTKLVPEEYITDISAKGWHSMILTSLGRVLVFGSNRYGQLGIPSQHSSATTTNAANSQGVECVPLPTPTWFKSVSGIVTQGAPYLKRAKLVSAGVNHSLIATEDGYLYSSGWAEKGQLGLGTGLPSSNGTTVDNVHIFTEIPLTRKLGIYNVSMISCGGEHSMLLTDDSRLFIFGKYKRKNFYVPTLVQLEMSYSYSLTDFFFNSNKKRSVQPVISQISSGDFFALILTKDGRVYSFGDNDKGQCAQPSKFSYIEKPKQITFFTPEMRIKSIVAGSSHAFALTEDGKVYGFGRGEGERLALFDGERNHYEPQHLQCLDNFGTKKIAASGMFTVVCNSECELEYAWIEKSRSLKMFATKLQTMYQQNIFTDVEIHYL